MLHRHHREREAAPPASCSAATLLTTAVCLAGCRRQLLSRQLHAPAASPPAPPPRPLRAAAATGCTECPHSPLPPAAPQGFRANRMAFPGFGNTDGCIRFADPNTAWQTDVKYMVSCCQPWCKSQILVQNAKGHLLQLGVQQPTGLHSKNKHEVHSWKFKQRLDVIWLRLLPPRKSRLTRICRPRWRAPWR